MPKIVSGDSWSVVQQDCLKWLQEQPDNSVDLILGSPPYENQRAYAGLKTFSGENWVAWAKPIYLECVRVSRGAVVWVVEGKTVDFRYSSTPQLLHADLHRAGVSLRKPPAYRRFGIPGSGGPDWFRNDYEVVLCSSKGRIPHADPTACGHPPVYAPGGSPSHRTASDRRVTRKAYKPPKLANPGNVVDCRFAGDVIDCKVGKGHMGHELAHENEAPFPTTLSDFFIKSLTKPGDIVVDIFCGSGTTLDSAIRLRRRSVGIDLRPSQVRLAAKRAKLVEASVTPRRGVR